MSLFTCTWHFYIELPVHPLSIDFEALLNTSFYYKKLIIVWKLTQKCYTIFLILFHRIGQGSLGEYITKLYDGNRGFHMEKA